MTDSDLKKYMCVCVLFFWPLLCLRVFNRLNAWDIFMDIVSESDKPALWATKTLLVVCVKTAFSDLGKHSPDGLVSSAASFRLYLIKREILFVNYDRLSC